MHHKEFMRASDDAKLLLMLLPPSHVRLFIFGRPGDMEALHAEIEADPMHAMILWPGDGAITVDKWIKGLPADSTWSEAGGSGLKMGEKMLRVVVLDAVYRTARMML